MSEFYVGQKVVCIKSDRWRGGYGDEVKPAFRETYTIRDIVPSDVHIERSGLLLVEICNEPRLYRNGFGETNFAAHHFRPLEEKPDAIEWARKICRDIEADARKPVHV